MSKPTMEGIPLLVLGNKSDLPEHLDVEELTEKLNLKSIDQRKVSIFGISAKEETNLEAVLKWLMQQVDA